MTVIEERSDARILIDVDDQQSGAFPQALLYPRRTVLIIRVDQNQRDQPAESDPGGPLCCRTQGGRVAVLPAWR
jgi:hypothetical protein